MTRPAHTPDQLAKALGWTGDQVREAQRLRVLPTPDVHRPAALGPRWSPTTVRVMTVDRDTLKDRLDMGDLGAFRLAELMTARLGVEVNPETVAELALRGHLPSVGVYRGHQLYAVWTAVQFTDRAVLEQAAIDGELRTTDGAAAWMEVRRSVVDRLVDQRWLRPVKMADNPHRSRRAGAGTVALYRTGDLAAVLSHPGIDWPAVRATPRGGRAPLPTEPCSKEIAAELKRISAGITWHQLGHRRWVAGDRDAALDVWRLGGFAGGNRTAGEHLSAVESGDEDSARRCGLLLALSAGRTALV